MSRMHTRRLTTAACGLALLAALGACGSGSDEPSGSGGATSSSEPSESSSGSDAVATEDLADPGEDLLDGPRLGVVFEGTDQRLTWRFPESYESETAQQATSGEGAETYEMTIGFKAGTTAQAEGESVTEGMEGATVEEVQVRDKTMVTTAADTDGGSLRTFFWTPEGSDTTYAVLFYAIGTSVTDTPAERLDELYQTIGSLAVDDRTG
ncbi:hypothetical protein [Nocardioides aurantiacus]|uniref:Uncharacterized protein n=1 Tax=Nocardioides aurantiacus TaxID=86796 RepID=A0A3N2CWL7_9ACTN|nr:hypothetical protein [Nocardioides aurantiacus]ROR91945.1 hypothetical protein EDD33_2826 [Nocardioides aurantiacus]